MLPKGVGSGVGVLSSISTGNGSFANPVLPLESVVQVDSGIGLKSCERPVLVELG